MKQAKYLLKSHLFLCAGLLSAVAFVGCGKEEITVYNAPKDLTTPPSALAQTAAATPSQSPFSASAATQAPVRWKTPPNWKQLAPTSMRVGNFSITEGDQKAEMAILPFPGSIGGELENVNRWRGEIGLEPVKEGAFKAENVAIGSENGKLYDLAGEKMSTLAAWLEKEGVHWFFKMRGDKELVAKNKPALIEFLKSIEFKAPEQAKGTATAEGETEEDHSAHDHGPKWQTPSHWKEGPDKQMVVKNWDIGGDDKKTANVSISSFPGEVGGVVQNVNRWRGQLGLAPMSEGEVRDAIKTLETSDGHSQAMYVDFTGKDRNGQPARMISAIVPHAGDSWFYKIMGDSDVIEREKTAFLKLVQTANYH